MDEAHDPTDRVEQRSAANRRRRPSAPWLVVSVAAAAAVLVGAQIGYRSWTSPTTGGSATSWFAGYADVTATPAVPFETASSKAPRDVVLAFVVSAPDGPCKPTWGATLTLDQASTRLDLDRKVAQLERQGAGVAVSFGGQQGAELATTCTDARGLVAAYAEVLDRYHSSTIDLDVEAANLSDRTAGQRRADAIKKLQLDRRAAGRSLAVWLTLPVSPGGLTEAGQAAVAEMLRSGVDLAGVNAMTMDYGSSRAKGQSMLQATTGALSATQGQVRTLYSQAGTALSSKAAWSKLGVTPMIGQNDVPGEVFGLDAATSLNQFVLSKGIGRVSMWSLNRDMTCGPSHVDVSVASDACSGVSQGDRKFADLLASGVAGRL